MLQPPSGASATVLELRSVTPYRLVNSEATRCWLRAVLVGPCPKPLATCAHRPARRVSDSPPSPTATAGKHQHRTPEVQGGPGPLLAVSPVHAWRRPGHPAAPHCPVSSTSPPRPARTRTSQRRNSLRSVSKSTPARPTAADGCGDIDVEPRLDAAAQAPGAWTARGQCPRGSLCSPPRACAPETEPDAPTVLLFLINQHKVGFIYITQ